MDYNALFSQSARVMQPSPIRRMAGLVNQPGVISFAGGMPNPSTFPEHDLKAILDDIVEAEFGHVDVVGGDDAIDALPLRCKCGESRERITGEQRTRFAIRDDIRLIQSSRRVTRWPATREASP